ncbi:PTS lactose/cellobiose transporter subunit IIA [Thermoactinomyces mirandus]|uniref:PTS lactose/cellobiose transporter subunit IIA n=1 Tax=Thermoactinomyces mirandus TaxID=2756294 RepID=A0A7W1XSN3_9BACL|nr:PTS lactose/cellobiose transporter subunit IIA [Thermoactinomyces mirandus]MBA4602460.1 PTS lactose/cellobiose transporter subunit IIA [Thermoactinomyces mirandus]
MNTEKTGVTSSEMKLEEICFQIIACSGEALSLLMEALKKCRGHDYAGAEKSIDKASELLNQAHHAHTQLLAKEAGGEKIGYSVLLTHAQDNMMNTLLAKTFTVEMIEMYKALKG